MSTFKLTINDVVVSNVDILDKVEFVTDMGVSDFTVGKFIIPTAKIKLHEDVDIKTGDVVKIYIDDVQYFIGEPYEIKQQNLYREVSLYSIPYFSLTKTYTPTKENYTTRSLLLEMQTNIGFNVANFDSLSVVDMNGVVADTAINILQAIAMLLGANVTITNGQVEFINISSTTVYEISQSNITSITKSDTTDYHITRIIGKLSENGNEEENPPITVGTQANAWNDLTLINKYLTESTLTSILGTLPNYSGFDLKIFDSPLLKPLDRIKFTYKGTEYTIPIMNLTLTFSVGGLVAKIQSCVSTAQDKVGNYKGSFTSKLEVIRNVQSELNTKVEVVDGRVSSLITRTDVIEGEQTTIKDQYSKIEQSLGDIESTVGEVVTNMKIGNGNLVTNSDFSYELTNYSYTINNGGTEGEESNVQTVSGLNIQTVSGNSLVATISNDGYVFIEQPNKINTNSAKVYNTTISQILLDNVQIKQGTNYTFSFYYLIQDAPTDLFGMRLIGSDSNGNQELIGEIIIDNITSVVGEWTRATHSVTTEEEYQTLFVELYTLQDVVSFTKLQVQEGTVATEWVTNYNDNLLYIDMIEGSLSTEMQQVSELVNTTNSSDALSPQMKNKLVSESKDAHKLYEEISNLFIELADETLDKSNLDTAHTNLHNKIFEIEGTLNDSDENGLSEVLNLFNNFYEEAHLLNEALQRQVMLISKENKTTIQQMSDNVNIAISQVENLNGTVSELSTHFNFSNDGLTIKSSADADKYIKLDTDSLDFMDDGQMVAQISNKELNITNATIEGQMSVGNLKIKPSGLGGMIFVFED